MGAAPAAMGMRSPMLDEAEIKRRKAVWSALADLWLDTEITDDWLAHIAKVMHESGYSIDELRHIYLYEVAPVVYVNTLVVTGERAGFDEAWLHGRIVDSLRQRGIRPMASNPPRRRALLRRHRRLFRLVALAPRWLRRRRLRSLRRLMTYATEEEWQTLAAMVAARRAGATATRDAPPDV